MSEEVIPPEEIEQAKAHCVCGAPMDSHDDLWLGHSPVSMFDYYACYAAERERGDA